jgi:hypothetical protein
MIAGCVEGLVAVGVASITVCFQCPLLTEFKKETASAFRYLWEKEGE